MPTELHINEQWKDALAAVGLDTFDALMGSSQGKCVSWHRRGQTYRVELEGGKVIFLKRDTYTSVKDIFTDLVNFRRPQPPCFNEMLAIKKVAELGIRAPEVISWGQRRYGGLPWQAAIIMTELPGVPMSEFLKTDQPAENRAVVMNAAGAVAAKLFSAGLSWPDIAPKHFIIDGDTVGILDLARMRKTNSPVKFFIPKQVRRFGDRFRSRGGSEDDLKIFLNALGI
ncbi:MAG: lipopolysaccharide kinase InaA family protein [Planctomycetota bacterium]|nr:lipopolysaccharide kinase InaA family protein [Planctomycetota bacterium]